MRRWTAAYAFGYTPVISFERRRTELLDWVEQNLEPAEFRDDQNEVGIALRPGVRIRISRRSVTLEDAVASAEGTTSLVPMLDGFFQMMEPRGLVPVRASIAWSSDHPLIDYSRATAILAEQVTGLPGSLASGIRAVDVASLVDFKGENVTIQAEYGIVSEEELLERLASDRIGRIKGRPVAVGSLMAFDELPPVSIFVDTAVSPSRFAEISDPAGVQEAIREIDSVAREAAEAIAAAATTKEEVVN